MEIVGFTLLFMIYVKLSRIASILEDQEDREKRDRIY